MPNTYTLIASNTVGSGGTSAITFSSIPSTYTDLLIKVTARGTDTSTNGWNQGGITFNSSSSGYSSTVLVGRGDLSPVAFTGGTSEIGYAFYISNSVTTANTFGSADIYIPNYASANYKSVSSDFTEENNAARAIMGFNAGLWSNTAAITSLTLTPSTGTLVQYSTAYLYGISKT
jgi:hypothetical protein